MALKKILLYLLAIAYVVMGCVILFAGDLFEIDKTLKAILGIACIAYGIFRAYRNYAFSN